MATGTADDNSGSIHLETGGAESSAGGISITPGISSTDGARVMIHSGESSENVGGTASLIGGEGVSGKVDLSSMEAM
jgi:hypothetical protein